MGEDFSLSSPMSVQGGTAVRVAVCLCMWAPCQGVCGSVPEKTCLHGIRCPQHLSHMGWLLILTLYISTSRLGQMPSIL